MEASTLKTKKPINKGKIKKTLKNVLCRPDPIFWPLLSDEDKNTLVKIISNYKVDIPQFQKPHWKELKLIPKENRPKPPKIKKVEGLIFGISECCNAVKSNECAAILVEGGVNPRIIVQPLIETCVDARIPVLCVTELRTLSYKNFGIPTSCVGVKPGCLTDLLNQVLEIAKRHELPSKTMAINVKQNETLEKVETNEDSNKILLQCPYVYRTDKKVRAFVPSGSVVIKNTKNFTGQDFVKFSDNSLTEKLSYKKMIVKKISNNPNRLKVIKNDFSNKKSGVKRK